MFDNTDSEPGSWIYLVYLLTLAPWGLVQVFDALDAKKRHVKHIPVRLGISFVSNFVSAGVGLFYVYWAASRSRTESATMLVGVFLNSWYWKRNLRGWRSYRVLFAQKKRVCELVARLMRMRMQGMPNNGGGGGGGEENGVQADVKAEDWTNKWDFFLVNDSVIDNDRREDDVSLASGSWHSKIGGDVLWRMVWLQGTIGKPPTDRGINPDNERSTAAEYALGDPPCDGERWVIREEALDHVIRREVGDEKDEAMSVPRLRAELFKLSVEDQTLLVARADESCKPRLEAWKPQTRAERIESLSRYDVGQQDIGGLGLPPASACRRTSSFDVLWSAMSWVTSSAPPPMENIWYDSAALVDHLERFATVEPVGRVSHKQWPTFPRISQWYRIAGDLARLREVPLLLSVGEGRRYAMRLASVSALLADFYVAYQALCVKVHRLGIRARWTHGWSGLISCYSMWWTLGNVSVALLGGLPLLAILGGASDHDSVACLLVGLASETIMSTYLSDANRAARTKELARRYYLNKGKTCRGSGVACIREAMDALGLPRSASQLDGVIAFSAGWAMEAVRGLPGNQKPRDGQTHGQIEDIYCSSRAYRFTDERL